MIIRSMRACWIDYVQCKITREIEEDVLLDGDERRCGKENTAGQMRARAYVDAFASTGERDKLGNTNLRILFNELFQNRYRKNFRRAKYKHYTAFRSARALVRGLIKDGNYSRKYGTLN